VTLLRMAVRRRVVFISEEIKPIKPYARGKEGFETIVSQTKLPTRYKLNLKFIVASLMGPKFLTISRSFIAVGSRIGIKIQRGGPVAGTAARRR